jgi:hypothetical protein
MFGKFFLTSLFFTCFWIRDPGSEIRDPGSEIRDPGWVKIRIRDKHPVSATLHARKKILKVAYSSHLQYSVLNRGFAYAALPSPSSLHEISVNDTVRNPQNSKRGSKSIKKTSLIHKLKFN